MTEDTSEAGSGVGSAFLDEKNPIPFRRYCPKYELSQPAVTGTTGAGGECVTLLVRYGVRAPRARLGGEAYPKGRQGMQGMI